MPTLTMIFRSSGSFELSLTISFCSSTAQLVASTALANSTRNPSPMVFTTLPSYFGKTDISRLR